MVFGGIPAILWLAEDFQRTEEVTAVWKVSLVAALVAPIDDGVEFPSSGSGDAPATNTSVLVNRFRNQKYQEVRNKGGESIDKPSDARVVRDDGDNLRSSSMAVAAVDRFELKNRAAWWRKFGVFWGRWGAGLLGIYTRCLVVKR